MFPLDRVPPELKQGGWFLEFQLYLYFWGLRVLLKREPGPYLVPTSNIRWYLKELGTVR